MTWNKSKNILPEEGLFMGMMPYLCCDEDKSYFLAYIKNGNWISYERRKIIKTPNYWTTIK